jgi:hypothetical protein
MFILDVRILKFIDNVNRNAAFRRNAAVEFMTLININISKRLK